jgi:germacradienol/geosmin synthase
VFCFDDHFLETFKRSRDLAGAKAYLARLPQFMPVTPSGPPPDQTNSVERGLADLWVRMTGTTSSGREPRNSDRSTCAFAGPYWCATP